MKVTLTAKLTQERDFTSNDTGVVMRKWTWNVEWMRV